MRLFAPAGLLVSYRGVRVALDGGPGAEPPGSLDAWLVTDERAELISALRRLAAERGVTPGAHTFRQGGLVVESRPVVHTNHPTCGYRISAGERITVWAPEFLEFPPWAADADLMFAEASGWSRPILFRGGGWRSPRRVVGGGAGSPTGSAPPGARPHRETDDPGDGSRGAPAVRRVRS